MQISSCYPVLYCSSPVIHWNYTCVTASSPFSGTTISTYAIHEEWCNNLQGAMYHNMLSCRFLIYTSVCGVYKLICYISCPFIMTGFFAHKQYKIWSLRDCTIIHKIRDLTTTEYTWRGCHNNSTNRKNSH